MKSERKYARRCTETVTIKDAKLFVENPSDEKLSETFSEDELRYLSSEGYNPKVVAGILAAKEACCKLFAEEFELDLIGHSDFSIPCDIAAEHEVKVNEATEEILKRNFIGSIAVFIDHGETEVTAVSEAKLHEVNNSWIGKVIYHCFPWRRDIIMQNLHIAYGGRLDEETFIEIAQASYAHFLQSLTEIIRLPFMTAKQKDNIIRVENVEALASALKENRGVLLLTGHFGNWELATVAGVARLEEHKGLFTIVRKILKPKFINDIVTRRFRAAGFDTLPKKGSVNEILDRLQNNSVIVVAFDQRAVGSFGIKADFFGREALTFKSLAVLAQTTGALVVPASSWREPDGKHVLTFHDALESIECDDYNELIMANTILYNQTLERIIIKHPEQWIWMYKRWNM